MVLTLLLALGLAGIGLALFARAAVLPRIRAEENVGRISAYGYGRKAAGPSARERTPVFPQLAAWVGAGVARWAPAKRQETLRSTLMAAGAWGTNPASIQGYRVILAGGLGALALWGAASTGWPALVGVVL